MWVIWPSLLLPYDFHSLQGTHFIHKGKHFSDFYEYNMCLEVNFLVYLACIWQPEYFFQPLCFMNNTKWLEQFQK